MKPLFKIIGVFVLLFHNPALAKTGEISGLVFNGTKDSSLVKNINVNLLVYKGHELINDSTYSQQTNSQGKYQFTSIQIDTNLIYYPRVTFHSIVYYGNGVRFEKEVTKLKANVVVYDTTSQKKDIYVQMEHLFLEEENGKISVREIFLFVNKGKRTFLGEKVNQANIHYVLKFPLPEGFENFQLITREAQNAITFKNNTLYETDLMSPGTRQFSYRYQIAHRGKEWNYQRPIIYPTGSVNIFLSNPELGLEGQGIMPMGDFVIRGKNYQHYSIQNLMPGMNLELTLKNLPDKTIDIKWIILIVVALFLVIGFSYTLLKKQV